MLVIFPVSFTIYIVYALVRWTNETLNTLILDPFDIDIPGLGIITVFFGVSLLGFILTRAFIRPLVNYFESIFSRLPLVNIIYTSIKELTEAFVGEKKKFSEPVLIKINEDGLQRLGFITSRDLSKFELKDKVAVYCPHSYNFSGNLFITDASKVEPLQISSSEIMKYVISAGVTDVSS